MRKSKFWASLFSAVACTNNTCVEKSIISTKSSLTSKDFANADEIVEYLKKGNKEYIAADYNNGNISAIHVSDLYNNGQKPYAVIIACGDSRVVPEYIFMTGLGELFVIRVAGNVAGDMEIASAVYGAELLGIKLIVVLGHTNCGAIASAMEFNENSEQSALSPLLTTVKTCMGNEKDPAKASLNNANAQVKKLLEVPELIQLTKNNGLKIISAIYNTDTGIVDFY